MELLRGGVIGFGNIGQNLTQHIQRRRKDVGEIVIVCDIGTSQRELAKHQYGLQATAHIQELVDAELDFVLVTSPNAAHAEQVVLAAKAGLHVFCEKPMALTLEDADRMIAAVESSGVVNVVNYSMRYIDAYLQIKEMVDAGQLGRIMSISHFKTRGYGLFGAGARHPAVEHPEQSGGWTVHHACHDIDFLYWLNGPITTTYATTQTTVSGVHSEEVILGHVTFQNGAIGMIGDSVCCIRDHYTQVIGTQGSLVMSGEHDETVLRLHREGEREPELISARDSKRPGGGTDHFFECIASGTLSPHNLRSARHSLAVALAMQSSARTGQILTVL